jgi:carbon monoxide dehydrogenase subunit G
MAFEMDGEFVLPASRERVWEALNDPDVLRRCIQGCRSMERAGDDAFTAQIRLKVGPVVSEFQGNVRLLDLDPPNSYRIEGQGDGGAAGFAKGGARVTLSDAEGGTRLHYAVHADIGGRLAQLGGRLINGVAKKQADQFFQNFAAQFAERPAAASASAPAAANGPSPAGVAAVPVVYSSPPAPPRSVPSAWFVALAVAVVAGFALGRSDAGDWWILAMIVLAIASAGAGFRAGRG